MAKKSDQAHLTGSESEYSLEDLEVIFQLEKVIRFEKLLSTLAAAFTNLPADRVDQEIERGLELVADFLGADRAGISQYSTDRQTLQLTHRYVRDGIAPHPLETFNVKDMFLWYKQTLETMGKVVFENLPDDLPAEAEFEKKFCIEHGIKSNIVFPLWIGEDSPDGYIGFTFLREKSTWLPQCIERVHFIGEIFANVLRHQRNEELLKKAYIKIEELSKGLDAEIQVKSGYDAPLKCIDAESGYEGMLGHSDAMEAVMAQIKKVARTDSTVLVFGETGTGKELAARAIHQLSSRRDKPMVRVNCAAIPESLIESELFGHEKGAFTGADSTRLGRFEIADGSTIFLDEIGELPLAMQAKLLHVLELQQLERVGGSEAIDIDVRVVAATNKDLAAEVKEGNFREDLFYRLNIFPIELPPLRQRKEDIPMLAWTFIQEFSSKMGKVIEKPLKAMELLKNYPWPGNVRELRNVIERSMILTEGQDLNIEIPRSLGSVHSQSIGLEDVERDHITEVLAMTGWKVRGQDGAAELLHLKPSTLESKMQKLGIKRPG
ncbi:MAG: sigma 54-interacting transcriptional regulator [Planctomycetota bacterium]|jgi:transcriptional regulator with GAF, ATPase, and Fis domain